MLKKTAVLGLSARALAGVGFAQEGPVSKGVSHLHHVLVIMRITAIKRVPPTPTSRT
jgi:hypothetical protein